MPRVGIVNSPQPNAFATGRGPQKSVVVATSSILQALTPTELEAVIGHEIGHVVHRDVLTSSVAATMAGVISYIGNIALYSMMFGGSGNNRQGGNPIALVAAIVLVPLGATFVRLGIPAASSTTPTSTARSSLRIRELWPLRSRRSARRSRRRGRPLAGRTPAAARRRRPRHSG